MRRAFILTLGFDERFCYRAILRHGIADGDKIVLITAGIVEKVRKAYEWIRTFVERSYDVEVRLVEVNVKDLLKAIGDVIDLLDEFEDYSLVINLSGGMRALAVTVLFALLMKPKRNVKLEIELEDLSGVVEIPTSLIRMCKIKESLTDERRRVLRSIAEGNKDTRSLAKALGKDVSTIRRHISALEELGLVRVMRRKPLEVTITKLAELIME